MNKIVILTGLFLVSIVLAAQNPRSQQGGKGQEKKEESATGQQEGEPDRQKQERTREARGQSSQQTEQAVDEGRRQTGQNREQSPGEVKEKNEPGGHAYGRNKGNLSGRDFGQARAVAARSEEEKVLVTKEVAVEVEEGVRRTTRRVEEALGTLEEKSSSGEISEEEYEVRMRRVNQIEEEIKAIEVERRKNEEVVRRRQP